MTGLRFTRNCRWMWLMVAGALVGLASCNKKEITDVPVDVISIVVSETSIGPINVGVTRDITAIPRSAANKALTARTVQFSSKEPAVATISATGQRATVTARSAGSTNVEVRSGAVIVIIPVIVR